MIVAFDLHNIRDGGGMNYIRNLLEHADPSLDGFTELHLVAAPRLLAIYPDKPWIIKHPITQLGGGLLNRIGFVRRELPRLLRRVGADILYAPGGLLVSDFRPVVTISRNMMPFRPEFWGLYPMLSWGRLRLHLLRRLNAWSFAAADGMIFLSNTAKEVIGTFIGHPLPRTAVIAHGVDHDRFRPLRQERRGRNDALTIIYPSRFEPYKHQVEVVRAIAALMPEFPTLRVLFCGPTNPQYFAAFNQELERLPLVREAVRYLGEVPNVELPALYAESDLMLFASSCENLPNILIEAMASGVPICSSDRSPMPEIGRDACAYFDPADPESIAAAVRLAAADWAATLERAERGLRYAQDFAWAKTARQTFAFIAATYAAT